MEADFVTKQGDSALVFDDTLTYSDGNPVDLTGATVSFIMQDITSTTNLTLTGPTSIITPSAGTVKYQPSTTDTAVAGSYMANWSVVFPSGTLMTFPTDGYIWVDIQPSLAGEAGLTNRTQAVLTVAEVIKPSVAALSSMCRARTVQAGSGGTETGIFNNLTRPTQDEAEMLIDQAVTHVLTAVGYVIPNWAFAQARQLCLYYAARLVEVTFYALAVSKGESPYAAYGELYNETLTNLTDAIEGDVAGAPHQAFYSLPVMTTRQMRFDRFWKAVNSGDFTHLPDDMRYPMGPKGLPFTIPGNSMAWNAFDWGLVNWDTWMEVSV